METQIQKAISKAQENKKFAEELRLAAEKGLGKKIDSAEMINLLSKFSVNPKEVSSPSKKLAGTTTILTTFTTTSFPCTMTTTTTTTGSAVASKLSESIKKN